MEVKFKLSSYTGFQRGDSHYFSPDAGVLCMRGLRDCIILPRKAPSHIYACFTKKKHPEGFKIEKFSRNVERGYLPECDAILLYRIQETLYKAYIKGYRYVHIEYDE